MYTLSLDDQKLLDELGWKKRLQEIDEAIMVNAKFIKQIVADTQIFLDADLDHSHEDEDVGPSHSHSVNEHSHRHGNPNTREKGPRPTDFDMDKLRSTLKQFVRDWADEGKAERDLCYEPMKEALLKHFETVPELERCASSLFLPSKDDEMKLTAGKISVSWSPVQVLDAWHMTSPCSVRILLASLDHQLMVLLFRLFMPGE